MKTGPRVILFIALMAFSVQSCTKDDETVETKYSGWAVGGVDNGYGSILNTDNDGLTWSRQGEPTRLPNTELFCVGAFSNMEAWVVGDILDGYGMILHTTNGGVLWNRKGSVTTLPNARIRSVRVIDRNTAWFAGDSSALFYTSDMGETFHPIVLDSIPPATFTRLTVSGSRIWVVGFPSSGTRNDSSAMVLYSADGGLAWVRQGAGSNFPGRLFDVCAVNDTVVFASGTGSVFKTKNGGQTWQQVLAVTGRNINGIWAVDANNVWAVGDDDAIYHSINSGNKWDTIIPPVTGNNLAGITATDNFRVWITGTKKSQIGPGVILYTRNGGQTWFSPDLPVSTGLNFCFFPSGK